MNLSGNTILITGGATGIGFGLATALADRGNTVLICSRSREKLAAAKQRRRQIETYQCDISDDTQRQGMLKQIRADGHAINVLINVLINNAAVMHTLNSVHFRDYSVPDIRHQINVNLCAPIALIHELLPLLTESKDASIINILSPSAIAPAARMQILAATKAALYAFTRTLRIHLESEGIAVIDVFPPGVDTAMTKGSGVKTMPPSEFARRVLLQLDGGKQEIWIGQSRILKVIAAISHRLAFYLMNKQMPLVIDGN